MAIYKCAFHEESSQKAVEISPPSQYSMAYENCIRAITGLGRRDITEGGDEIC